MKKLLLIISSIAFMNVSAQRFCGTPKKMNNFFAANPEAKANQEALRNFFDH